MNPTYYIPHASGLEVPGQRLPAPYEDYRLGDILQSLLVSIGLFGQQAIVLVAAALQMNSRVLTVPGRAFTACLALSVILALLFRPNRARFSWPLVGFLVFWGAYGVRLLLEAGTRIEVVVETGRFTLGFIATMSMGACFLPALAILINSCWSWHRAARIGAAMLVAFTGLAMLRFYGEYLMNFEHRMSEGETVGSVKTINALSIGYLGAALSAFSLYSFVCQKSGLLWRLVVSGFLGGMGVFLLVGSASRGPVLAVAVTGLFLIASQTRRFDFRRLAMLLLALTAAVAGLIYMVEETGSSVLGRLMGTADAIAAGSEEANRLDLYVIALSEVAYSPLIGTSTTIQSMGGTDMYPHNLFIESLVATGLLGTIPLVLLLWATMGASWRILTRNPEMGWLPILFVLYFAGSMFSGAIFSNVEMWLSMAATLSCDAWARRVQQAEPASSELAN